MVTRADLHNDKVTGRPLLSLAQICSATPERISVCRPQLPSVRHIAGYLSRIDTSRRYSNHGALLLEFQDRLRATVRQQAHVAVAASGTAALAGAILATAGRAKPHKSLCLVPAYTFIGTVAAIEQCGFTPYFVDVDPTTWVIDAASCEQHRLLDQVGLVVPVAPYGRPVPQIDWVRFSQRTGIPVVIDGAAAFESLVSTPSAYLGVVPVAVSFHATKSFCTGEGGAVFCGDAELGQRTMRCLNFGYDLDRVCRTPSINGKMSEYHAAVGLAELDSWQEKLAAYGRVALRYRALSDGEHDGLHLAPSVASNYALLEAADVDHARAIVDTLSEMGIGHRKWYGAGAHRQPYCAAFGRDDVPVSESLAERLIGLPMSVDLAFADINDIMAAIRNCSHARHRHVSSQRPASISASA
ncbi:putative DegT/DnrJ/EryC1/StrS aminotransferase [Beijerinckiaceae bacterium RH AL1]|nr:DegT/DnrJ/EryC1/StrS family aminotransferase [Beijerinckiaceae bacterium]VVB42757.1 putative DegT/DnrJ/EryC1/StrS aminotransferase [Beijerinckiaceae bacterium RH AL8]VVB42766.1 putative DegT/DnrJ/EryC1/StrS aminotransferase [Beijerinckiaceae bacterium RH CH11]VVC53487.1 putative DegT/DnrJ/EryC1/StrS aminotransferase [Beijerinckiaceae bacterium RH AL1]